MSADFVEKKKQKSLFNGLSGCDDYSFFFLISILKDISERLPVEWITIVHKQLLPQCASIKKRGLSKGASPDIVICHGFMFITLLDLELTHTWKILVQLKQHETKVKETCVGPVFHNLHANAREIRVIWWSLGATSCCRCCITKHNNKFLQCKNYRGFLKMGILQFDCRIDKSTQLTL